MRFIGPFENIHQIISHGLKMDTALLGDEIEETVEEKRMSTSWVLLWQKFPGFHDTMLEIHKNHPLVESIAHRISAGMDSVRADDSGTVKPRIYGWVLETPTSAEPVLTAGVSKATRGIADPLIAPLLLPLEFTDAEKYPDPYALIAAGKLDINGEQCPCFLFPYGQLNDDSALDTILTGPILLCTAKALLMGPASALQGDGWHRGKADNAQLIGLLTFTGRIIAYIARQVRFNLASQQDWNKCDNHFDYQVFFWQLVGLFEGDENQEFAARTIALYNRVVLGRAAGIAPAGVAGAATAAPTLTHLERLKAACAARVAAAARTATAAVAAAATPAEAPADASSATPVAV
ncbi:hypothetical protein B0H17DRAFT_1082188 [Mycena rosella]|uniref:Uncharacterized protein n=1 Tax=Mycena rosella TaxID=1033263 RepID=A0AAD7D1L0_MYCRO|nr:hypothetical protein B0H17DRAFT_1082188 [Mycena rosella]